MRRSIDPRLLVTSWNPEKNKQYSKTGKKPTYKNNMSFNTWLQNYCEESSLYMRDIAKSMGISISSLGNYLYKGKLPSFNHFMLIVDHVSTARHQDAKIVFNEIFDSWKEETSKQ